MLILEILYEIKVKIKVKIGIILMQKTVFSSICFVSFLRLLIEVVCEILRPSNIVSICTKFYDFLSLTIYELMLKNQYFQIAV